MKDRGAVPRSVHGPRRQSRAQWKAAPRMLGYLGANRPLPEGFVVDFGGFSWVSEFNR